MMTVFLAATGVVCGAVGYILGYATGRRWLAQDLLDMADDEEKKA